MSIIPVRMEERSAAVVPSGNWTTMFVRSVRPPLCAQASDEYLNLGEGQAEPGQARPARLEWSRVEARGVEWSGVESSRINLHQSSTSTSHDARV